jgi:hypothetical protein
MKFIVILPSIDEHEQPELFEEIVKFSNGVSDDGELLYVTETLACPFCKVQFQTTMDLLCHMEAFGFNEQQHLAKFKSAHIKVETNRRFF